VQEMTSPYIVDTVWFFASTTDKQQTNSTPETAPLLVGSSTDKFYTTIIIISSIYFQPTNTSRYDSSLFLWRRQIFWCLFLCCL